MNLNMTNTHKHAETIPTEVRTHSNCRKTSDGKSFKNSEGGEILYRGTNRIILDFWEAIGAKRQWNNTSKQLNEKQKGILKFCIQWENPSNRKHTYVRKMVRPEKETLEKVRWKDHRLSQSPKYFVSSPGRTKRLPKRRGAQDSLWGFCLHSPSVSEQRLARPVSA